MQENRTVEHEGIVSEINDKEIKASILSSSACSGCHAKGVCGMAEAKEKIVSAPNLIADSPGGIESK